MLVRISPLLASTNLASQLRQNLTRVSRREHHQRLTLDQMIPSLADVQSYLTVGCGPKMKKKRSQFLLWKVQDM